MKREFLLLGAAFFGLSGCATIINGTSQDVAVRSDPAGAKVKTTNGTECITPCELNLKRRHDLRVDLQREGYKPTYVLVQSRTGGAVAGNILMGGIVGGIVDSSNGATNTLYPEPVSVKLAPLNSSDEAMLLNEKGKTLGTVEAHNDAVRKDVAETIGAEAAGLPATPAPGQSSTAADPVAATAPAVAESGPAIPASGQQAEPTTQAN